MVAFQRTAFALAELSRERSLERDMVEKGCEVNNERTRFVLNISERPLLTAFERSHIETCAHISGRSR